MKNRFKNVFNIVKKELDKIFKNPKTIFSTLILPGLLIFLVYSAMGSFMVKDANETKNKISKVAVINCSEIFEGNLNAINVASEKTDKKLNLEIVKSTLTEVGDEKSDSYKKVMKDVEDKTFDAYIYFSPDFDKNYNTEKTPVVIVYGKNTLDNSSAAVTKVNELLNTMQNKFELKNTDFTSKTDIASSLINSLVPMFLMIFIFAGGLSVGADSIAGEKERGTIATMLMAPIKKSEIIMGKILSVVIITILSAISPFVGVIAAIPKLMQSVELSGNYSMTAGQIGQLFVLILLTALIASAIYLTVSTIAKNVKEATTLASPLYMLAIIVGVLGSNLHLDLANLGYFAIPFLNLSLCFNMSFANTLTTVPFLITIFTNLAYFGIIIAIVVRLFKSEKLMFAK